eukprot:3421826-Amphidinium_carterae.1
MRNIARTQTFKTHQRRRRLQQPRFLARPTLHEPLRLIVCDSLVSFLSCGVQVVWEWPYKLSGWKLPIVSELMSLLEYSTRVYACAYGFEYKQTAYEEPRRNG